MKNVCFLMMFLSVSSFIFGQSQQNPIIGYDKLEWGATIEVFQRTYPTAREITSERRSIGVREFEQTNVGSGISSRRFSFFNNKFYGASVMYEDLNSNSALALMERIVEIYGKFDDRDEQTFPSGNLTINMIRFFRYYRNNMNVIFILNDIYNQYNRVVGNTVMVAYLNPITRDEVEAAERKQKRNELGL
ncbi:hypothetical protein R84B8_01147 [Treponema sp. R8-4-B8]